MNSSFLTKYFVFSFSQPFPIVKLTLPIPTNNNESYIGHFFVLLLFQVIQFLQLLTVGIKSSPF